MRDGPPATRRLAPGTGAAAEPAARRDHAVARDDDRDGVVSERLSNGAAAARHADPARDLAVGHDLARRDVRRSHEHVPLERRDAAQVDADVEGTALAGE